MALARRHTFQVLTKRPQRMASLLNGWEREGWMWRRDDMVWCGPLPGPLPNVHLGCSIELDRYCFRADSLRRTPAAVRFLSLEPLLDPLPSLDLLGIDWVIVGCETGPGARPMDLGWVRDIRDRCRDLRRVVECSVCHGSMSVPVPGGGMACPACCDYDGRGGQGGEYQSVSGPALFIKQISGPKGQPISQLEQFPPDLQIREFPPAPIPG